MSERKRIEVDGTLPDWEYTDATVDTTPPPRDWKPVAGEKVLVEAVVVNNHVDGRMSIMFQEARSCYPTSYGMVMSIPKPFIHPMPGKNG